MPFRVLEVLSDPSSYSSMLCSTSRVTTQLVSLTVGSGFFFFICGYKAASTPESLFYDFYAVDLTFKNAAVNVWNLFNTHSARVAFALQPFA